MRDSVVPALSAVPAPRQEPPPELDHIGILRLIDRLDAGSLRDWMTLRCFLEAVRFVVDDEPIPRDAVSCWISRALCDSRGAAVLGGRVTFENRRLRSQVTAVLTAENDAKCALGDAAMARVRRNFLRLRRRDGMNDPAPGIHSITPDGLDAALRALGAEFARLGASPPVSGTQSVAMPPAAVGLVFLGEPRSAIELFDAWRTTLHRPCGSPSTIPKGPLDIVSKMRPGDLRVVRERPTDSGARLSLTFPTTPSRTLELAMPSALARALPAFCNPLGPLEHDALRAELRYLPACRAVLDDDDRRARLYWSAAARYNAAPSPRRGGHRRARSWRAALLRGMVLASAWSGAPKMANVDDPAESNGLSATGGAAPWVNCRQQGTPGFSFAAVHAATPGRDDIHANTGFVTTGPPGVSDELNVFDTLDVSREHDVSDESGRSDDSGVPGEPNASDASDEPNASDESDEPNEPDEPGPADELAVASTATYGDLPLPDGADAQDDDAITLLWAHVSPGERRRIVAGARRFAKYSPVPDGSEGIRDHDAIRRLNGEGWYAYGNLPAIFFICEKVLDDGQALDRAAFHALLGDIGRATARGRATHLLCFEDQRNQSLSWRVDTTAPPGRDVVPVAAASLDAREADAAWRDATGKTAARWETGSRLVLKQIIALLARTNDPPFDLDTLLCAMIEVKHGYDADIAHHASRPVDEIRGAIRRAALERLIDLNRRGFPRRIASADDIATTGAIRFVDLLLGLLDPVLQAAPGTLAYGGADLFRARFGHYFAERNGQPGIAPDRWTDIEAQGGDYVKGWSILSRDDSYLAAMTAEDPALVRHLQSIFATEIARSSWVFHGLREGPPRARSTIARQFLLDAGIPPEHRITFRKFITLDEARTNHALLHRFDNGTFLDVYMAIDDGLERLRWAEPRYRPLLPDHALASLPTRREVTNLFNKAYDDKIKNIRRLTREAIERNFAAAAAPIRRDFLSARRFGLHLHRPLATEKSLIARYVTPMDEETHRYQRNVLGHAVGAIIETIAVSNQSRFYRFDLDLFVTGNRTAMLTPLSEIVDARDAGAYMAAFPDQFFLELYPSIYDDPIYYKNDVEPHLAFDCEGLGGVWEKWIDFRLSHQSWRRRVLGERFDVEQIQDDPLSLYVNMLPFSTCESVRQSKTLTLGVVLDSVVCLADFWGLRHVVKPIRTWIGHSVTAGRIQRELSWYEGLKKPYTLNPLALNRRIDALRTARKSVEELRRRRSTRDVAVAFRKISHLPFTGSTSTAYHLYQATQTALEIGERIRPFTETVQESATQRLLRWQRRNKLWEIDLRGGHAVEQSSDKRRTIVGELRHADEQALPSRLREAGCSPHVCVSACLFDSLASMTTRRRMRVFVKLLDGVSPQRIFQQLVRQGFLLTSNVLQEMTRLEASLVPLRQKFTIVRDLDFAPTTHRRGILTQSLLHPYANTTANARLQAFAAYQDLAGDLYALNFFFESPLQQLVQTLDLPCGFERPCRAPADDTLSRAADRITDVETGTSTVGAPRPSVGLPEPTAAEAPSSVQGDGVCTRPGEDNEIRTCLLPIVPCADQRALPPPAHTEPPTLDMTLRGPDRDED